MLIYAESEAKYFCQNYDNNYGSCTDAMNNYCLSSLSNSQKLLEGSPAFEEFRSHLLRHVERNLFLSAANYNLGHKLMTSGYSNWTHVTLYYGAYYSARALLGMFGVYIDMPKIAVDVLTGNEGSQEFMVRMGNRPVKSLTTYIGSHRQFWDIYYKAIQPLNAYVMENDLKFALTPILSNPVWQVEKRNEINYSSFQALTMIKDFETSFNRSRFPASLPGILNTQFRLTEALTLLSFKYAKEFGINTDAFSLLPGRKERIYKFKRYIFKSSRGMPIKSRDKSMLMA